MWKPRLRQVKGLALKGSPGSVQACPDRFSSRLGYDAPWDCVPRRLAPLAGPLSPPKDPHGPYPHSNPVVNWAISRSTPSFPNKM